MLKLNYLKGILKNIFNLRISLLAIIDNKSEIHPTARLGKRTKLFFSSIGSYTYISSRTEISHAKIGKFCSVGRDCAIGLPSHSINHISTSPIFTSIHNALKYKWMNKNSFKEFNTTTIGNDVWIGSKVIIQSGVNIGSGSVIGAGAVVTKNFPPYSIIGGVPAKIIRYRFDDTLIKKLLALNWWDMSENKLKENIHFFNKANFNDSDIIQFLNSSK